MKTIEFKINMDIEDEYFESAMKWEHHADYILDLNNTPEIKSIYGCKITDITDDITR